MTNPICWRCGHPIGPDAAMQFEDTQPVHKTCWGKFPVHQDDLPIPPLPYMDREEFEFRVWLALILISVLGMVLLP